MRLPRLDFPGARHHVMNRGARRAPIFADDDARRGFLRLVADLPVRFGVRVHAYALMPNHFHLLLESVRGELGRAMRHVGGEYTRQVNVEGGWDGPVFRGRYRNRVVETDDYWRYLLLYVHANPVRAGLSTPDEARWTSHLAYLGDEPRPDWLHTATLEQHFGSRAAYLAAWHDLVGGRLPAPAGFEPDRLWRPQSSGAVATVAADDRALELERALACVGAVTGMDVARLIGPAGRGHRSPAKWLAAWWMSRHRGIDHGRIAAAFGVGHDAISRMIRRGEELRQADGQFAAWVAALQKMSGVNT